MIKGDKVIVNAKSPYTFFKPGVTAVVTDPQHRAQWDTDFITVRAEDSVAMPAELKTLNRTIGITLQKCYFDRVPNE